MGNDRGVRRPSSLAGRYQKKICTHYSRGDGRKLLYYERAIFDHFAAALHALLTHLYLHATRTRIYPLALFLCLYLVIFVSSSSRTHTFIVSIDSLLIYAKPVPVVCILFFLWNLFTERFTACVLIAHLFFFSPSMQSYEIWFWEYLNTSILWNDIFKP